MNSLSDAISEFRELFGWTGDGPDVTRAAPVRRKLCEDETRRCAEVCLAAIVKRDSVWSRARNQGCRDCHDALLESVYLAPKPEGTLDGTRNTYTI